MSDSDNFEVDGEFLHIGRTFEEYHRMFGLGDVDLDGTDVLDCAGGPSSFTAVANAVGADAVSVDPMYGPSVGELEEKCANAVEANIEQLREKRDLFVWEYYDTPDGRKRYLRAAYERFLADYAGNPGRYCGAALPRLPFEDDAFDLALSGNFLFLYDDRLDRDFHLTALRELGRVAREVRIFPLASLDRERSDIVSIAIGTLQEERELEIRTVPYEFQPDVTEVLVLSY